MQAKTPHALNVPGDFYVEDGCCTSCELPFTEAPGHFKYDDALHCFVCKQPSSPEDVDNMVSAVAVSDLSCVRYSGDDPETLRKLVALNAQDQCDMLSDKSDAGGTPRKVWWALWRR